MNEKEHYCISEREKRKKEKTETPPTMMVQTGAIAILESRCSHTLSCARFVRGVHVDRVIQSRFQLSEVFVVNSLKAQSVVLYGWLISDCTALSCTTSCRTSSRHRSQQPIQEHGNEGSSGIDWIIVAGKKATSWATFTPDPI